MGDVLLDEEPTDLMDEERELVVRAVPKRRREFVAGRTCARRALAQLGIAPTAIGRDDARAPTWPAGVVGSITHTRGFCAAAVASASQLSGLGIDAERVSGTDLEVIVSQACRPAERHWIDALPECLRPAWATVIFSAKESAFKCIFPLRRRWMGFDEAELDLDVVVGDLGSMTMRLVDDGLELQGRYAICGDLALTAIGLEPGLAPERMTACGSSRT